MNREILNYYASTINQKLCCIKRLASLKFPPLYWDGNQDTSKLNKLIIRYKYTN